MRYSFGLYVALVLSIVITGSSSVWNERVIKHYDAPLQQVNMIMYAFGILLGLAVYIAVPHYHEKAFFEGYSRNTVLLVLVQAFYGLCVSYAYKYADVLIKNLSSSATLVVLVFLSSILFHTSLSFNSVMGCVAIVATSYIYLSHAPVTKARSSTALAASDSAASDATDRHLELESFPITPRDRNTGRKGNVRLFCQGIALLCVLIVVFVFLPTSPSFPPPSSPPSLPPPSLPPPHPPPTSLPPPSSPPAPPVVCQEAVVAVCMTGQLRGSLNTGNLERSIRTWHGVGAGCVDFFLSLSFDGNAANINHGACPPRHPRDVDQVLQIVKPISWRFYNGTNAIGSSNDTLSTSIEPPRACRKPADYIEGSSILCGSGDSEVADCRSSSCTHCEHGFPYYIIPQTRTHACLIDIMNEEQRRASPYQYVVSHRPDYIMQSLPSFRLWPTLYTSEHLYVCNACQPSRPCAVDFFFFMRRQMLPAFYTVLDTYLECQSRAFNVRLGLPNTDNWPWYFGSEGIYVRCNGKTSRCGCKRRPSLWSGPRRVLIIEEAADMASRTCSFEPARFGSGWGRPCCRRRGTCTCAGGLEGRGARGAVREQKLSRCGRYSRLWTRVLQHTGVTPNWRTISGVEDHGH